SGGRRLGRVARALRSFGCVPMVVGRVHLGAATRSRGGLVITTPSERGQVDEAAVWSALAEIPDPEIPAISVVDLGIVHRVDVSADTVRVEILPTVVGCPALGAMRGGSRERRQAQAADHQ